MAASDTSNVSEIICIIRGEIGSQDHFWDSLSLEIEVKLNNSSYGVQKMNGKKDRKTKANKNLS